MVVGSLVKVTGTVVVVSSVVVGMSVVVASVVVGLSVVVASIVIDVVAANVVGICTAVAASSDEGATVPDVASAAVMEVETPVN